MRLSRIVVTVIIASSVVSGLSSQGAMAAGDNCQFEVGRRGGDCTSGAISEGSIELQARTTNAPKVPVEQPSEEVSPPEQPSHPASPPPVPRGRMAADVDVPCSPSARLSGGGLCADGRHAFLPPAKARVKPADPVPVVAAVPGVSLADVAQFVPRDASIRSQPNGWAIVGAPVNLFTDATAQVVDGVLLGRPAQVRFVPVSFTWDHGDGTSTTVQGPGASWRELGQQDFTSTDTSHVYASIGDRQVALTIAYSPSYRFDGGAWVQIPGTLPVQVGPVTIHVLQGSTVLVGGACGSRDAGPGCP
ncbi:hypothetical protein B5P21_10945 [Clavibacter michiganensis subsp. insidiosus]|nr:hypothetical protein B5P21_10945 [Clavibacter michiganensis subsp. insidiosus]